jgi:hypothetical protein
MIDPAVPVHRGHDAEWDTQHDPRDGGEDRQLSTGREVAAEVFGYWHMRADGNTHVALHEIAQVAQVLFGQRPIQAPLLAERCDDGRILHRTLAQMRRHRIGRHAVGHDERNQRHPDHEREHEQDALRDQSLHARGLGADAPYPLVSMYGFTRHDGL